MNERRFLDIERNLADQLPQVFLTRDLSKANQASTRLTRAQCDCDCACAMDGQAQLPTLSGPVACHLELTAACPNRCPGCGNVFTDRQHLATLDPPLSLVQWEIIINKLFPGVDLLKLTGGEPTHYPEFFSLLQLIQQREIPFILLSNGSWPEPCRLLDELVSCPHFRGFLISLHGPNAQTHERFTATPGSFIDATNSIRAASQAGFDVTTSTVLASSNLDSLRATAETALELGANHIVYERYIGEPRPGIALSENEFHQAIQNVQALEHEGMPVRFGNCIPQCFERSSSTGCTAGRTFCTVDPWGNVRPCNHAHIVAGNLLTQSLEEVWWSEPMTRWREVASLDCLHCQAYSQCYGGCRALSYGHDADPLMKEPLKISATQPQEQVILYTNAIPESRYTVRSEQFSPILICDGRVIPVSPSTQDFLEIVDRRYTLVQIQREYGDQALSFVGELYLQRFVDLRFPNIATSAVEVR